MGKLKATVPQYTVQTDTSGRRWIIAEVDNNKYTFRFWKSDIVWQGVHASLATMHDWQRIDLVRSLKRIWTDAQRKGLA